MIQVCHLLYDMGPLPLLQAQGLFSKTRSQTKWFSRLGYLGGQRGVKSCFIFLKRDLEFMIELY